MRMPCICNGLATHGTAHRLASCCKQRIGAFRVTKPPDFRGFGEENTALSAEIVQREYQSPCLWDLRGSLFPRVLEEGSFQGVLRGEFAGENPLALFVALRFVFAYGIP